MEQQKMRIVNKYAPHFNDVTPEELLEIINDLMDSPLKMDLKEIELSLIEITGQELYSIEEVAEMEGVTVEEIMDAIKDIPDELLQEYGVFTFKGGIE